jgi:hypothetical protein
VVEAVTAAIGVWLVYLFWPRRLGWGLHCKRCGYYQERQGRLAPACPEMRRGVAVDRGETRAVGHRGAGLVALGVLLCLLAGVGAVMTKAAPWVYLRSAA